MSNVTNLILHFSVCEDEDEKIKRVNAFFREGENPLVGLNEQPLPHGWYGGNKFLECNLYVGAFNYFNLAGFLKHLNSIKWGFPEDVQLFVMEQHDYKFRIIHGVEEYDDRTSPLHQIIRNADDLLEDIEPMITDEATLRELREWRQAYLNYRETEDV